MPRFALRPALVLLGVLLCLAACTPTARPVTVGHAPTAPTAPTVAPVRVPAGWKVLTTPHFRIAYPPDWTTFPYDAAQEDAVHTDYIIAAPDRQGGQGGLDVSATAKVDVSGSCRAPNPQTQPAQQTTLAGLPMYYRLFAWPEAGGPPVRWWVFLNAQRTAYTLRAYDGGASAAIRAQDDAILGTFRPDNVTPWQC